MTSNNESLALVSRLKPAPMFQRLSADVTKQLAMRVTTLAVRIRITELFKSCGWDLRRDCVMKGSSPPTIEKRTHLVERLNELLSSLPQMESFQESESRRDVQPVKESKTASISRESFDKKVTDVAVLDKSVGFGKSLQKLTKEQVSYVLKKNNLGCLIETFGAYDGRNLAEDFEQSKFNKPHEIPQVFWDAFWKRLGKWKQGAAFQLAIPEGMPKALGKGLKTFLKKQNVSPLLHDVLAQNDVLSLSDFKRLQDQPGKFQQIQQHTSEASTATQIDMGNLVDTANEGLSFADRANAFNAQKALFGSFIQEQEKVLGELEKKNEERLTAAKTRLTDNLNSAQLQMEKTLELDFSKLSENRKEVMAQVATMKAEAVKGMNAVLAQTDVLPQEQATHFQLDRGILLLPNGGMEIKQKLFSTCNAYFTTKGELKTFDSHKESAAMREISTNLVLSGFAGLSTSAKVGGAGFVGGGLGAFAASSSATLTAKMESSDKTSSGTQSSNIYSTYSENIKNGEVCIDLVDAQKAFSRSMRIKKELFDISDISKKKFRRKKMLEWMCLNGSHVSLKVDVGGQAIREYDAVFKNEKKMSEKRHLMGIVVGAHASAAGGFFCPAGGGGGGVTTQADGSATKVSLTSTNAELKGISFSQRQLRNGGDPRVSIDLWKTSLQYKRNMVVINRYTDHVFPIWRLFPDEQTEEFKNEFKEVWINEIMLEGETPTWVKTMQELNGILCPEAVMNMNKTILWGCDRHGAILRAELPSGSTTKQLSWRSVMDGKDFEGAQLDVSYKWVYCVTDEGEIMRKPVDSFRKTWERVTWSVEAKSDLHLPCTCVTVTDNKVYFANEKLLWRANADSSAKHMPCDEVEKIDSFRQRLQEHFENKCRQLHDKCAAKYDSRPRLHASAAAICAFRPRRGKLADAAAVAKGVLKNPVVGAFVDPFGILGAVVDPIARNPVVEHVVDPFGILGAAVAPIANIERQNQNREDRIAERQKREAKIAAKQKTREEENALKAKMKDMISDFKIIQIHACNSKHLYALDNHGNVYRVTKHKVSGKTEYRVSLCHVTGDETGAIDIQNIAVNPTGSDLWACDTKKKIWTASAEDLAEDEMLNWKKVSGQSAEQIHVSDKWICCTQRGYNPIARRKTADDEDGSSEWIVSDGAIEWIVAIDK